MAKIKILAVFLILALDRLTKWYVLHHPKVYLGDFVQLELVKNKNLYFIPASGLLLSLIGAILLLLLILLFKNLKKNPLLSLNLGLIILGGASNLFDRLYYGFVIDWIRLFSVFNLADIMIISGVLLILLPRKK